MSGNPLDGRSEDFVDFVTNCLPASHYHWLNQKITDKHAMKIAEAMIDWEITLAEPLDLTRAEIADLNAEQRPQIRRRNVLLKWKDKKKARATYGNLLECCLEGDDNQTAEKICEVLSKEKGGAPPQQGGGHPPPPQPAAPMVTTAANPPNPGQARLPDSGAVTAQRPPVNLQQEPIGMFDYFEKGTVDSDGKSKVVQYEAADRGTHVPQLKLGDYDEITTITPKPLRVEQRNLGYYPTGAPRHGIALIINNQHFSDVSHRERVGTARDEYNLKQTFLYLGYRPVVCNDLTKAEITYIFTNLDNFLADSNNKAQNKVANDSFVCCILSHGNKGVIISSDSQTVEREDIETMIGGSETLRGKPKLIFIQACQGDSYGTVATPRVGADDTPTTSKRADFYLCFATVHGDKSYRDKFTGSWFITEVCKLLCEYATYYDLPGEFQQHLNQSVANNEVYRFHRKEAGEDKAYTQQPSCSNQLHKNFHFFLS